MLQSRLLPRSSQSLAVAAVLAASSSAALAEDLTLRINDITAQPGELVAVVLRTYAPHPVEQGQICIGPRRRPAPGATAPFVALQSATVFSDQGDAVSVATFEPATQQAMVEFSSLTSSINTSDGPLAVFYLRLDGAVAPGEELELDIDLGQTYLIDASGQQVPLRLRSGELEVEAIGSPRELSVEADPVASGTVAHVAIGTSGLYHVAHGQIALQFDPAFVSGTPTAEMDPRYGVAVFTTDTSVAGRVTIDFQAAQPWLNAVPGDFLSISLPTTSGVPSGTSSPLGLDPSLTYLEGPLGETIPLELVAGTLDILGPAVIFADGFESGDVSAWSRASP